MDSHKNTVRIIINPDISYASIDNEMVILGSEKNHHYYGLNPMGATIFKLLEHGGKSFDELLTALVQNYQISTEQCTQELKQFIDKMSHNHLLYLAS